MISVNDIKGEEIVQLMNFYFYDDPEPNLVRTHPWTEAEGDPNEKYYDLKINPEYIRTRLEDFVPYGQWQAIQTFYNFLEWLNVICPTLESNDCAFTYCAPNNITKVNKSMVSTGRVMILFSRGYLELNTDLLLIEKLREGIGFYLNQLDSEFIWGSIGISFRQTMYEYLALKGVNPFGLQLYIDFHAWGDSEEETMTHLDRLFKNLWVALRKISEDIEVDIPRPSSI